MKLQECFQRSGEEYYKKIVENFGNEILLQGSKELDRKKLARIIFYDKTKKELLDKLTFLYVVPKIKEEAKKRKNKGIVIIDVPLLFEMELDKFCDITIGIIAERETCIERICQRDKINEQDAISRINSQNEIKYFKENCDYCINNENENIIEKQINEIFSRRKFIK